MDLPFFAISLFGILVGVCGIIAARNERKKRKAAARKSQISIIRALRKL